MLLAVRQRKGIFIRTLRFINIFLSASLSAETTERTAAFFLGPLLLLFVFATVYWTDE